jgi:transglutaminase-like putative cysteine protease
MIIKILFIVFFVFISLNATELNSIDKRGILVWFYTLEINKKNTYGNIYKFKQTAGATYKENIVHNIAAISKQSKIKQEKDGNWYLNLANKKIVINNKRPLFLGQIVDLTLATTKYKLLLQQYNKDVKLLKYDKRFNQYLLDRKDLKIYDKNIQKIKNELLLINPKIYDYILAVDKFVHNQLKYKKPTRPNTAIDLLKMNNGWCGEFNKLKESLLRAAGIPTRDVYASHYGINGPSYDYSGASKVHVWLQSYIPSVGWISIPSTRKILNTKQFISLRGNYYIRAIDLYKYKKEVQKKIYSYKKIKRIGGIRGNGMFFEVDAKIFNNVKSILNVILDYKIIPSITIFRQIKHMPKQIQTLMYWFLISVPNENIYTKSVELFIKSIEKQKYLDFNKFYIISPTIVKQRIDLILKGKELE